MLELTNISVHYGVIQAISDVSFNVKKGTIVSLIGANGAGKSTILKVICGLHKVSYGTINFEQDEIQNLNTKKIVEAGISLVPEGRHVFAGMTVLENLELGAYLRKDSDGIKKDLEDVYNRFPILKERKNQDAATLSGGEQQMLAIGRALMSRPKLLLLDEPSMGLAPIIVKEIFSIIKEIKEQGTTVLLIEQNAKMALSIADYGYVLENGLIALEGKGEELLVNDEVKKLYLGG